MALSSIAAIALSSLKEQAGKLEATAGNIANPNAFEPMSDDAVGGASISDNLASDILSLHEDEHAYRASAAVFETGADLWDILSVVTRD